MTVSREDFRALVARVEALERLVSSAEDRPAPAPWWKLIPEREGTRIDPQPTAHPGGNGCVVCVGRWTWHVTERPAIPVEVWPGEGWVWAGRQRGTCRDCGPDVPVVTSRAVYCARCLGHIGWPVSSGYGSVAHVTTSPAYAGRSPKIQ